MHAPTALLLTSFLSLLSSSNSAPADASPIPAVSCTVPELVTSTIANPFALQALVLKSGSIPFPVLLPAPSVKDITQPYISRSRVAQPLFRLTGGNLTTGGGNHLKFPAYFSKTVEETFPPPLRPILFGGEEFNALSFFAGFACDAEGKRYLELRGVERFAVQKLAEGQQIYGKPDNFIGTAPTVHLKINEQL